MLVYLAASCRGLDAPWLDSRAVGQGCRESAGCGMKVLIAVLFSPFIGPASAYCFVLRSREQQRLESLTGAGEALLP